MKPKSLYIFLLTLFFVVIIAIKSDFSFQMTFGIDIRPHPYSVAIEKPTTRA